MDHRGVFVLFQNGAVVPGEDLTLPNYSLYTRRDAQCRLEVVIVINCRFRNLRRCYRIVCATREVGEATCEVVQNNSCPVNCYVPQPCPPEPVCETSSSGCASYPTIRKRCKKSHCAITKDKILSETKFVFKKNACDYDLLVYQNKLIDRRIQIKSTSGNVKLNPKILKQPEILLNVIKCAMEKFEGCICLYVTGRSRIYVSNNGTLYEVRKCRREFTF